jgi:glyoxylase-like metal-dependent hydrolase (beta-lactamase superfamily II)
MEILSGIHQVDGVNANCYIVARESLTIIDTGMPGNSAKIIRYITDELRRNPSEISSIVLTHAHMDHVGGVKKLKQAALGAKVAVHSAEAEYFRGKIPIPPPKGMIGILTRIMNLVIKQNFFEPDILLTDGDRIDGLVSVHIPGHTPGSLGLLDETTRTFWGGDIFRYDGKKLSEGPKNFTQDIDQEQESIRKIAALDFDILLPGHGIPLRTGAGDTVREFAETLPR